MSTPTPSPAKARSREAWANFKAKAREAWHSLTAWALAAYGMVAANVDLLKEEFPLVAPYLTAEVASVVAFAMIALRVRRVKA